MGKSRTGVCTYSVELAFRKAKLQIGGNPEFVDDKKTANRIMSAVSRLGPENCQQVYSASWLEDDENVLEKARPQDRRLLSRGEPLLH